jgi:hypothetical protein
MKQMYLGRVSVLFNCCLVTATAPNRVDMLVLIQDVVESYTHPRILALPTVPDEESREP